MAFVSTTGAVSTYEHARVAPRGEVPIRRVLILAWLLVAAGFLVLGGWTSSLASLESTLDAGHVHEVTVLGEGLPDGATGYVTQRVRWRGGALNRVATVVVRSPSETSSPAPDSDAALRITARDAGDYLIARHPGVDRLSVVREPDRDLVDVAGWFVPSWLSGAFLAVQVLALILLVCVHETWRATRAAWIWLWFTPFGVPAYLFLGGPGGPFGRPRPGRRRLTGGWAFVLMLALGQPWWR